MRVTLPSSAANRPEKTVYIGYSIGPHHALLKILGVADAIDPLIVDYRKAVMQESDRARTVGKRLYNVLIGPLTSTLPQNILVDPDGLISLLPFEALVNPENHYLVQRSNVSYVNILRNIAEENSKNTSVETNNTLLIVADPAYDEPELKIRHNGPKELKSADSQSESAGNRARAPQFTPLPSTRREAAEIAAAWHGKLKISTLLGTTATREAVTQALSPRILHIASHGYFSRQFASLHYGSGPEGIYRINRELQAGIAMAGANTSLSAGHLDGLLTLGDIEHLNLRGTELAVLSACDTANGSIDEGEGIDSLRRALAVAGARASITTLWRIPDAATTELMDGFYKNLAAGESKADALRNAKLAQMKNYPAPYFWSGFILSGER